MFHKTKDVNRVRQRSRARRSALFSNLPPNDSTNCRPTNTARFRTCRKKFHSRLHSFDVRYSHRHVLLDMGHISKSIEVNAPLQTVYNQWTQFEEFPRFMEGVEEVRQITDKKLFWRAKIGGHVKEWQADIVSQEPDRRISWHSVEGTENSGTVSFERVGADKTRVTLEMSYEPESAVEKVGDALGAASRRVEGDLKRFKEFIEQRGQESGAYRGTI